MGHMIEEIALERGHEVVGIIDPTLAVSKVTPASAISFDSEAFRSADVAIEFTTPATAKDNILRAWAQNVPVISGSTGWKPEELEIGDWRLKIEGSQVIVEDENGKPMLVWSSNFSVGVNIFFELNKFLAKSIQQSAVSYQPSITETHHIHKLDKPSGTARTLAEGLRVMGYGLQDSEIESIREGEVPGTHVVKWDSEEDTIIITHIAKGRRGFALGAVLAAESLV
jgi:4-hydroxy-tetrahydrodipicolinate reductase